MPKSERTDRTDALKELGAMVTDRREQANLSLDDIYDRTRIRMGYLRGIEEGNYEGFPEPVYIKGFVRTYLRLIGAEDLMDDFMAQLDRLQPRKQEPAGNILGTATAGPRGFKPASHFWLFFVLLLALAGTGGYVWYAWSSGSINNLSVFSMENWHWPLFPTGSGTSEDTPASQDAVLSVSGDVPAAAPVSGDARPEEPKPKPRPSLMIQARGDVWMGVTIGNKSVFNRTLRSGNTVSWDLTAPAQVRLGRPNMANITLNGKNLGLANSRGSKKSETYLYRPDGTWEKVK
ncbi:MAG: DUF4115 domain-containing protein [Fretibacterium sp.]|nr:DUF4115 domain-containing protein [Fretibacterium sp.]